MTIATKPLGPYMKCLIEGDVYRLTMFGTNLYAVGPVDSHERRRTFTLEMLGKDDDTATYQARELK